MTAFYKSRLQYFFLLMLSLVANTISFAQCPPNIDFEEGTFNNWQTASGSFTAGGISMFPTAPMPGRHDMLSDPPGNGRDYYGNFPKNCPNGSGYSIKIGNEVRGTTADEVSYTFTIPAGANTYNLIYHYAIVLNDANHSASQQPRLLVTSVNVTDNMPLPCQLDPIVVTGSLPGFFDSPNRAPNGSLVRYKSWAAASIKLDNLAGKTIRISFVVTGCSLNNGSHFGYAYIDLNSECSSSFVGATYCQDDAFINVTAPSGYQGYEWWNETFTTQLGNTQTVNFTPPPPAGTLVKVILTPYSGYGCLDTLTAELLDTLTVQSQAGPDRLSCQNTPVQLGANPKPTYIYSWSPVTGLNNPNIANPIATPSVTTEYVVTTTTAGGGCATTDTVIVSAAVLDATLSVSGPITGCVVGNQPTTLSVPSADSIQWYMNGVSIPGATQPVYNVTQQGSYYATVFSFVGCSLTTSVIFADVKSAPIAGFNVNNNDQCFANNQFNFTNISTIASGTMQYEWDLGDGTTATTLDVSHSYSQAGNYMVRLKVTSDMGCIDNYAIPVNVFDNPFAAFNVNTAVQCFDNNRFVFTNNSTLAVGTMQYNWDMGDGNIYITRDVTHSYTTEGNFTVRLSVTSDKFCVADSAFDIRVAPQPVVAFSIANPQQCYSNNQFNFINGSSIPVGSLEYMWDLGDGTTKTTRDVTHSYQPGDYLVRMTVTTDKGCVESAAPIAVKVFPFATADFYVEPVCIFLRLPLTNKTINTTSTPLNYLWEFGNGQVSNQINPVYSYSAPGTYTLRLSVNTVQCPQTITTKQQIIIIDAPAPGIVYVEKMAIMNFPEQLQARNIGSSVTWTPALSLDNRYSYQPNFRGINPQLYTIELKTKSGCVTVDTQIVKTRKKIEIYVPTVFTPGNGDGKNDFLRPLLMSFAKVNYFRVYNRWGKLLFQMQSDRPGWDGRVNGQLQEMQTVVWMIEAVDVDGEVHQRSGTTILMR